LPCRAPIIQQALRDAVPPGYRRNLTALGLHLIQQRSLLRRAPLPTTRDDLRPRHVFSFWSPPEGLPTKEQTLQVSRASAQYGAGHALTILAASSAEICTKTSFPPSCGAMKPYPLVALNHLTVPVAMAVLTFATRRAVPRRSAGAQHIGAKR